MDRALIAIGGEADRLVKDGLEELKPVLEGLQGGVLIIGGLMTRIWLHVHPVGIPVRATADVDLGIDRKALRLVGDRKRVAPLLLEAGFSQRSGDEQFRFEKMMDGRAFPVDLGVAPGSSRGEPPVLEPGISTIAVPGLVYALKRSTSIEVEFVSGSDSWLFELPLPTIDAAFVLKGALVASGVRLRPDRRQRDTVDAICLAAATSQSPDGLRSLVENGGRSDVRAAVSWIRKELSSPTSSAARRIDQYFKEEGIQSAGGEWAVDVATRFITRLEEI